MRILLSSAFVALCCVPAASAAPRAAPTSWGKPGVTFEQYRQDAAECATMAYNMDVSGTNAAKVFKRATQLIETNEYTPHYFGFGGGNTYTLDAATWSARIVEAVRPQKQFAEVRAFQQRALASCLADRGYVQFNLTKEQREHLARLPFGTAERHQYLYGLSVDPAVLGTRTG